ncbi:hypothetical protein [Actinacidiphila glaucinigra]|uniref:hypothetical protein n=1 Tax=Actinacidiphila glaucinigra TaxID=235986 RepID=UPI00117D0990|nr:hypothetical protein [Actinacidiphila glaucinigra]
MGDPADWDCALLVRLELSPRLLREALDLLRQAGLEPVSEDEHEAEMHDSCTARLWLVPIDPSDPFESPAYQEIAA